MGWLIKVTRPYNNNAPEDVYKAVNTKNPQEAEDMAGATETSDCSTEVVKPLTVDELENYGVGEGEVKNVPLGW